MMMSCMNETHTTRTQRCARFFLILFTYCSLCCEALSASSRHKYSNPGHRRRPLHRRRKDPLSIERQLLEGHSHVIGSDESGRGCLAGPIVTASCCILKDLVTYKPIKGVDDSKSLKEEDRMRIYEEVMTHPETYAWAIATKSAADIDTSSVDQATMECFQNSIESVTDKLLFDTITPGNQPYSIVDGHKTPRLSFPSRPWIRGDSSVYTVALASILARVTHDRIMKVEAAKVYPDYGFHRNGGYSTREHVQAIHEHGSSPLHRQTCKPVQGRRLSRKSFLSTLSWTALLCRPIKASAMTNDPKTGIALPDRGEIEASIPKTWSGIDNPFDDDPKSLFGRLDSSDDSKFYSDPRFVEHVDEQAVQLMTDYISKEAVQADTTAILDLCSSWTSHLKTNQPLKRVAGLGMNAKELEANKQLTEWTIQDLNAKPVLPYEDATFDVVLCQLSIDYLTKPLQVCREIGRVLKPGGKVHILFSNRLFLSKAVAIWTGADDIDHTFTVGSYLNFCNGGFEQIEAKDLSIRKGQRIVGDPLYVVRATKA